MHIFDGYKIRTNAQGSHTLPPQLKIFSNAQIPQLISPLSVDKIYFSATQALPPHVIPEQGIPDIAHNEIEDVNKFTPISIESIVDEIPTSTFTRIYRAGLTRKQVDLFIHAFSGPIGRLVERARQGENIRLTFTPSQKQVKPSLVDSLSAQIFNNTGYDFDSLIYQVAFTNLKQKYPDVLKMSATGSKGTFLTRQDILTEKHINEQLDPVLNKMLCGRRKGERFPSVDEFLNLMGLSLSWQNRLLVNLLYKKMVQNGNIKPRDISIWENTDLPASWLVDKEPLDANPKWYSTPFIIVSNQNLPKSSQIVFKPTNQKGIKLKTITIGDQMLGTILEFAQKLQQHDKSIKQPHYFSVYKLTDIFKIDDATLRLILKNHLGLQSVDRVKLFKTNRGQNTYINPEYPELDDEGIGRILKLGDNWRDYRDPETGRIPVVIEFYDPLLASRAAAENQG